MGNKKSAREPLARALHKAIAAAAGHGSYVRTYEEGERLSFDGTINLDRAVVLLFQELRKITFDEIIANEFLALSQNRKKPPA